MKEPKIRFKEFEREWEEKNMLNTAPLQRGFDLPSHSIQTGTVPIVYSNGVLNFHSVGKCVAPGLVTGRSGTIGKFTFIEDGKYWPHNTSLWVTDFFNNDPKFVFYLYQTIGIEKYSTGSGVPTLNRNDVHDIIVNTPSLSEQQSIATFFTSLDEQIKASGERVASLKQVKAASLQAMFPQEGETSPRLRFKGFTGDWQLVTLGEIFKERTERNRNGELLSVTMNNGIIKASENGRSDNSSEDKSNYKVVKVGDIAYNSMRMWQGASGCSQYEGIVSPAYTVIAPNENICSAFFSYYFKTSDVIKIFRLHSQGLTKDTWNLKYPMFSLIELYFPNNSIEQQKIADYFTNLDHQIALQGQRLEKLKQIKAACLEKMFV